MSKFDPEVHDDNPPMDTSFMSGMKPSRRGRPKLEVTKSAIKLRLDPEVIARFKADGPGWQSRINAVLRKSVGL